MTGTPATQTPARAFAEIPTPRASRYLQQLCKHFAHKIPVTFDALSGSIAFSSGICDLTAGADMLRLVVTPDAPEKMQQLQDVVARHLVRFAFREEIAIDWHAMPCEPGRS